MAEFLFKVDGAELVGSKLKLTPSVAVRQLAAAHPDLMMPMPGDSLRLHTPDGRELRVYVDRFGVEVWERDGFLYSVSDPEDPHLTLTVVGDLDPSDIRPGTEVWQSQPEYR